MVTLESINPISNAGNLPAFAVVNVGRKVRISDVRIIQEPNQRPSVSMPSRAYEKDGQRKWSAIVEPLDDGLKKAVSNGVLGKFAKLEEAPEQECVPEA